jgi:Asp-tRNA(Asn)/Glu-tRNA(Gln) amidotransferase A subunit family amidase
VNTGFWRLSAGELVAGYSRREFSPVEVLAECLQRIERLNPLLRAYLALNLEDARSAAKAAERAWLAGGRQPLLCGVPVSVKDTIEMRGLPTTYGSLAFANNYQDDSEIVVRLRRAGAVIVGKTNTSEFALLPTAHNRLGEPGCNPWDTERTCGGSSGGAAAAVAAGLGHLAVGTDSGGSIRQPAAYNGIFGLKPTYQRIPTVQRWRAAPGRSHNGPLARTVRDGALLMQALSGFDARDPDSELRPSADFLTLPATISPGTRVAVCHGVQGSVGTPPGVRKLKEIGGLLQGLGCEVHQEDLPGLSELDKLESGLWGYSGDHYAAAESLRPGFWDKHADDLTDYARPIYEAGTRALAWQYRGLLRRSQIYREQVAAWFNSFKFLLTPVDTPAPPHSQAVGHTGPYSGLLPPFNIARNPAAVIPAGFDADGLPRAVQIVGRLGDDVGVMSLAAVIEAMMGQTDRWPALT